MVFRALLFSYVYNIETCKILEVTFLTLHFCPMRDFSQVIGGAWLNWPNGKHASGSLDGWGSGRGLRNSCRHIRLRLHYCLFNKIFVYLL